MYNVHCNSKHDVQIHNIHVIGKNKKYIVIVLVFTFVISPCLCGKDKLDEIYINFALGFFLAIFQILKYKSNLYLVLKVILPLLNFIILGETTWSELIKGRNDSIPVITYHNKSEIKSIFTGLPLAFLRVMPLENVKNTKIFHF